MHNCNSQKTIASMTRINFAHTTHSIAPLAGAEPFNHLTKIAGLEVRRTPRGREGQSY